MSTGLALCHGKSLGWAIMIYTVEPLYFTGTTKTAVNGSWDKTKLMYMSLFIEESSLLVVILNLPQVLSTQRV